MQGNIISTETNIAELFSTVYDRGTIGRSDRLALMVAFVNNSLTTEEHLAIDRLIYSVRRGRLKMLD
ncbi:MAG TPA: hypothetical protein VK211_11125 [Kamptonema sp.]|nr:hypothetical protein [Kamptonema sp.]